MKTTQKNHLDSLKEDIGPLDFLEAFTDTVAGTLIGVPINFVLAWFAVRNEWTPIEITLYFTVTFFALSVYRKMRIRKYFREHYS